jgi:hypothetical protein
MKDKPEKSQDELRPEYNFDYGKAVRGKIGNPEVMRVHWIDVSGVA